MICRAYLQRLMGTLLRNGSSNTGGCYIALLKNQPSTNSNGYFAEGGEPAASAGYTRYAYSYNTSVVGDTIVAANTSTIYFDEATQPWTNNDEKLRYFALCESSTIGSVYFAYGELLDADGNPTSITVTTGQLPIIRKNMLKIQFSEHASPKYNVTLRASLTSDEAPIEETRTGLYTFPSLSTFSQQASFITKIAAIKAEQEAATGKTYETWANTWIKSTEVGTENPKVYNPTDALEDNATYVPYFLELASEAA